jgi:rhamnogalacturonan acetylesterase
VRHDEDAGFCRGPAGATVRRLAPGAFWAASLVFGAAGAVAQENPTVFVIGDSTVKNGRGDGAGGLWGWGDFLGEHIDATRVAVENHALGGRSSRTFRTEGHWAEVLERVRPGDYVLIQFGHNDGIAPDDPRRPRGTLRGTGAETYEIVHPHTGEPETVHTYGHYLREYIRETRDRGATPIVLSPVPRNMWNQDGTLERDRLGYPLWARQVAEEEGAPFIDLHERVARRYEAEGPGAVRGKYFVEDHTHANEAGARLSATEVAEGILELEGVPLRELLQ